MPERTQPAPPAALLRAVAEIGPFFAVRTDRPGPAGPRAEGYVPLAELYAAAPADGRGPAAGLAGAPPALRHRYATVAQRLGTAEIRVVASLSFQGLAGRLWSLALGGAALAGRVPDLDPHRLWWHPERGAPGELWLPGVTTALGPTAAPDSGPVTASGTAAASVSATSGVIASVPATPGAIAPGVAAPGVGLAEWVRTAVLDAHLVPLHRAAVAASGVSGTLLWGNAGSALGGALGVLRGWLGTAPDAAPASSPGHNGAAAVDGALAADGARSRAAERVESLAEDLFATEPLRSTGRWSPGPRPAFRRRTCCLYYRVPGGGLCGDCALPRVPGTAPRGGRVRQG